MTSCDSRNPIVITIKFLHSHMMSYSIDWETNKPPLVNMSTIVTVRLSVCITSHNMATFLCLKMLSNNPKQIYTPPPKVSNLSRKRHETLQCQQGGSCILCKHWILYTSSKNLPKKVALWKQRSLGTDFSTGPRWLLHYWHVYNTIPQS